MEEWGYNSKIAVQLLWKSHLEDFNNVKYGPHAESDFDAINVLRLKAMNVLCLSN